MVSYACDFALQMQSNLVSYCSELIASSAVEWHKSRGCFVILSMKLVSLAFDIDKAAVESPSSSSVPHPISFLSYTLFPATIILGPFITYTEYVKFTSCNTLVRHLSCYTAMNLCSVSAQSVSWLVSVVRSFLLAMLCLAVSSCVAPMLFPEHHWNKLACIFVSYFYIMHSSLSGG